MLFVQPDVYGIIIQVSFISLIYVFRMNVYSLKSWIFNVFQPVDTSIYLIEKGYPLWFVYQTDTMDDLISNGYSLWFIFELDLLNVLTYIVRELE
jgi:hypothetical protein